MHQGIQCNENNKCFIFRQRADERKPTCVCEKILNWRKKKTIEKIQLPLLFHCCCTAQWLCFCFGGCCAVASCCPFFVVVLVEDSCEFSRSRDAYQNFTLHAEIRNSWSLKLRPHVTLLKTFSSSFYLSSSSTHPSFKFNVGKDNNEKATAPDHPHLTSTQVRPCPTLMMISRATPRRWTLTIVDKKPKECCLPSVDIFRYVLKASYAKMVGLISLRQLSCNTKSNLFSLLSPWLPYLLALLLFITDVSSTPTSWRLVSYMALSPDVRIMLFWPLSRSRCSYRP
jgi:hypothetical protein